MVITVMAIDRTCKNCGVAVAEDAPFGHCSKCLIEVGFGLPSEVLGDRPAIKIGAPMKFGDYQLLQQIGRGGMGVVYKARQISLNRIVALKMVLDSHLASPIMLRRFLIEAEAAAKLEHPNIVPIYEVGQVEGQHFFSMRFIAGENLERKITDGKFQVPKAAKRQFQSVRDESQERIATLMATVASAVQYAHQRGVLHRDLKPSNILMDDAGQPHLTDFGLAKVADSELALTPNTAVLGTPGYMSPEQAANGQCTIAADIYSLGAILYELLTGKPPFEGPTPLETLRRTKEDEPLNPRNANPAIHPDLATICLKCLEKNPLRRYATAAELGADLHRWLRREPIVARPANLLTRSQRWIERNRAGTAVIACLLAGLLLSLYLLKRARDEERDKQAALVALKRVITSQIGNLNKPPPSVVVISSEQLAVLQGHDPKEWKQAVARYRVAAFIWSNPLETILGYQRLFEALEGSLSQQFKYRVALDCYLYLDYQQAGEDLLDGKVDLLHADPRLAASLSEKARVHILAKEGRGPLSCAIFTRRDSGITNLADLGGRFLVFWDRHSSFTFVAKAMLASTGLCATNVKCVHLQELQGPGPAARTYLESPEQGYFDRQGETVRQVLDLKAYDAGVARTRQFRLKKEGEWRVLAEFAPIRNFWVGTSKMTPGVAQAFRQSFLRWSPVMVGQFSNAEREGTDNFGAGYEVLYGETSPAPLKEVEQALSREAEFENCSSAGSTPFQGSFGFGNH